MSHALNGTEAVKNGIEALNRRNATASEGAAIAALPVGPERRPEIGTAQADAARIGADPRSQEKRVRHYTELDGAEGRGVFFRPHRYSAADLLPLAGTVSVGLGRDVHRCEVRDVSQNGVAFSCPSYLTFTEGQRISIALHFGAHESFRGEARIGSVREQDGGVVVGVSFNDYLIDVDEILELRDVHRWTPQRVGAHVDASRWRLPGGDRFRALVSELRLLLEDAEEELTALDRDLPWHVLQGPDNPVRAALVSRLRAEFVSDAVRISEEIDAAVREIPQGYCNEAAKDWAQRHVDRFLMQAPILHRARHKPFGYPGDYEVMNFIYERNFEGATLFGRAVGLAFTQTRAARAVRYRKDLVKRQLRALLDQRAGSGRPVRVLSIASGPAQELTELLDELRNLTTPLEVVLFEQDKNALTHAWRRLRSRVDDRFPGKVRLTFLHESIKRLLRDGELFAEFGKFDLIYSCGLYDYLAARTAVVLTRYLAASCARGGKLLIANMVDHPTRWIMEHHLDWKLIYRTRQDLIEMGERAVPGAQLRVLEEESGANPFIDIAVD